MPVSSLHIIRNATTYKHSTVLHFATDLNLKFVYFVNLLPIDSSMNSSLGKKYQKNIIIHNKCHRKPHYSSINLSQKYNTNLSVNVICSGHLFFFSFTIVRWYDQTMKIMTFSRFLNCRLDFHPFHFVLMKEIIVIQSYKGNKSRCSLLYILYQNHIVN